MLQVHGADMQRRDSRTAEGPFQIINGAMPRATAELAQGRSAVLNCCYLPTSCRINRWGFDDQMGVP
jgi:hypothetical protein